MTQDHIFQQLWEFRRKNEDFDSSSDDSKSCFSGETILKKHKLVSNLILCEDDGPSDETRSQHKDLLDSGVSIHFECGNTTTRKTCIGLSKKGKAMKNKLKRSCKKGCSKTKNKCITLESHSPDGLKRFSESILEELKIARENMFALMREEMSKILAFQKERIKEYGSAPKTSRLPYQDTNGSVERTENHEVAIAKTSVRGKEATNNDNCFKVNEKQAPNEQIIKAIASSENDKGDRLRLSIHKPRNSLNYSNQAPSFPYLTSPGVLLEPQKDKCGVDFSSSNHIQPGVVDNGICTEMRHASYPVNAYTSGGSMDKTLHASCGYFSAIQAGQEFRTFAQMGHKNTGHFERHGYQSSSMGVGFPVPIHQGLDNGLCFSTQFVNDHGSQDNFCGLRMHGEALRFSGTNQNFTVNNFASNIVVGTEDIQGGHFTT